jgi:hypothetical protein
MQTMRLADPATQARYPLPVIGAAAWLPDASGWRCDLVLPPLAAGTIVVPSLALGDAAAGQSRAYHQWTLLAGTSAWRLPASPATPAAPPAAAADGRVSQHIDCWHVHEPLAESRLQVWLTGAMPPRRYLLCASARPLAIPDPAPPDLARSLDEPPPPISQMTAPADLASRICSPTSVAMVLQLWGDHAAWLDIVAECRDAATGLYGVWPLAIAAAARRGSLGAIEAFASWQDPLAVLARGIPLVTSVRFQSGALPGAPLAQTAGHLVVVHGAGPDTVAVNDPAAPDAASVRRVYPAAAFTRAWLAHRGAAYILPP